jgi:hypothetical protein
MSSIEHGADDNPIHSPFKYYYTLMALGHLPSEAILAVFMAV